MKKLALTLITIVSLTLTTVSAADTFYCTLKGNSNKGFKLIQSADNEVIRAYNSQNGQLIDVMTLGKASAGNYRYYGASASIYVYKNKRNISIRSFNRATNRVGPIFGVYNCRS